jgi:hypothetical protein
VTSHVRKPIDESFGNVYLLEGIAEEHKLRSPSDNGSIS